MRSLLRPASSSPPLGDAALLFTRVALGVILAAHGWQKFTDPGLEGASAAFGKMGVPAAEIAAPLAATTELVGGIALVLGVLTPIAAALNGLIMIGAFVLVHAGNGLFVTGGGYELVLAILAGLVTLAALGAGRFSVDHALADRSRRGAASPAEDRDLVETH